MNLKELQSNWQKFGKQDPLWAILTVEDKKGGKWDLEQFFDRGRQEIDMTMDYTRSSLGLTMMKGRALDFGCGVGRLTQALAKYFEEVVGVDIAPSMLEGARKYNRFGDKCQYVLNERDDLRIFDRNHFDFIYSNMVLHHMQPAYCKAYLKEFLRVLSPSGLLIFYMPSEVLKQWSPPPPPQHPPRSLRPRMKQLIKGVLPKQVLNAYIKYRYESRPVMETYCIKRAEIIAYLRENGGDVLDAHPDNVTIPNTEGFRYAVTKH